MKQIIHMIRMDHIPESFSAGLVVLSVPPFALEMDVMMNVIRHYMFPPGKIATFCCVRPVPSL